LNPARGSESLHGVVSVRKLAPPLATGMTHVRFSPDGREIVFIADTLRVERWSLTRVDSGEVLLEKNQPLNGFLAAILAYTRETPYFIAFSTDGHWLLAAPRNWRRTGSRFCRTIGFPPAVPLAASRRR